MIEYQCTNLFVRYLESAFSIPPIVEALWATTLIPVPVTKALLQIFPLCFTVIVLAYVDGFILLPLMGSK